MITQILVNTSGSAKRKTNEVWFLSSAIHPATRIFSKLSHISRISVSAVHQPPTVPIPICLGNLQWGSTWAGRQVSAYVLVDPGFWEVTTAFSAVRPLFRGCPLQTAVSYHRNCGNVISLGFLLLHQIELKLIQGFPSCSAGGRGGGSGAGSTSHRSHFDRKRKTHPKLEKLNREVLKLGVNIRYSNRVICS